jgi:hypothetical protein
MMREVKNSKGLQAITSNQWHIVLAHLTHPGTKRPYVRTVDSEHADRASCLRSARALRLRIAADSADVPKAERDEVFVRRPNFKSLKKAKSLRRRRTDRKNGAGPSSQTAQQD